MHLYIYVCNQETLEENQENGQVNVTSQEAEGND